MRNGMKHWNVNIYRYILWFSVSKKALNTPLGYHSGKNMYVSDFITNFAIHPYFLIAKKNVQDPCQSGSIKLKIDH
jgi:hypothetical protein